MHTQASPDTRRRDQLFHEFRLFFFQLRELVHNDQQMGQRLCDFPVLIHFCVFIDIHICPAGLCKDPLSPCILTLNGYKRAVDLVLREIRHCPRKMGQLLELVRHASALEIHQEKRHILRAVIHCQGEYPRLEQLALS